MEELREKEEEEFKVRRYPIKGNPIVVNGREYKTLSKASEDLGISNTTIRNRVISENDLYKNWYYFKDVGEAKILDDRLMYDPTIRPDGLYKVEGEIYYKVKEISKEHGIHISTIKWRLKSRRFTDWIRLI